MQLKRWASLLVVVTGLLAACVVAYADQSQTGSQEQTSPSDNASKRPASSEKASLEEVVVTGHRYLSVDTSGATNLPVPIEQVPQSISLVDNGFIQAANLKTLGEIAEYTPGAINVGSPENAASLIKLRGFNSGESVDGVNIIGNLRFEPEYAIYDRLEIVKGPSSVVYGISTPGGLVNFVTKSATDQTPSYVLLQAQSWYGFRAEAQLAGALDADGHVRAIGVAVQDQGDSFMNQMYHKNTTLYGGLNFDLGSAVTGYLHGGYQRQQVPSFDGIPTEPDGTPAPVARSFFVGSGAIGITSNVYHSEGELTWHVTDLWDVSLKGNYQKVGTDGGVTYSFGLQTNGDLSIVSQGYNSDGTNYGVGLSSIYKLDDLHLSKSFISVAALYQNSDFEQSFQTPSATFTSVNINEGQAAVTGAFNAFYAEPHSLVSYQQTKTQAMTLSAQALLQVLDPLALLVGVSYSEPKQFAVTTSNFAPEPPGQEFDFSGQVSYRAALTYEFLPKTFAYLSYSQSFEPQSLRDVDQSILPPITGDQYEAGIKYRSDQTGLLLTAAAFQINEKNVGQYTTTIDSTDYFAPLGEVRHRGVELQGLGQILPGWQINIGYAYLDPRIISDTNTAFEGQTELYLPKNTFSLYTTYTLQEGVLRGVAFGGGVRYSGAQRTSYDSAQANAEAGLPPTRDLPGYTIVDVTSSYTVGKWLVQLNVNNVFNRYYFINNYQTLFYGNAIGAPTNWALSVRRQF